MIHGKSNSAISSTTSASPGSRMPDLPTPAPCSKSSAKSIGIPAMISTRSPLRISLGGGGTDLPSYYREHGGFLIAGAINKYVYVNVMRPFTQGIYLKYSHLEHVDAVDEVQHPIIREAIGILGFKTPQV